MEYGVFLTFSALTACLSARTVFRLGRALGRLSYLFGAKRKSIARVNLDIAFGDSKSPEEKNHILRESFNQLAVSFLQCLWVNVAPEMRLEELIDGDPEGVEVLKECIGRGAGVFLLMAHYGNWEIAGIRHGTLGVAPLTSIVRKLDNPLLEERTRSFRTLSGNSILYKDESILKVVRAIKNNQCVVIMMDQNMAKGGIFVDCVWRPGARFDDHSGVHLRPLPAKMQLLDHAVNAGRNIPEV